MAGKPKDLEPRTEQVMVRLTRDELRGLERLRQDGESRADVFRRLLEGELLAEVPEHYAELDTLKISDRELDRLVSKRRGDETS